jgi:hypothetical protein
MGGKYGVGLVATFDAPTQRAITVDALTGPYIIEFHTSTNEKVPTSFDDWDRQLGAQEFSSDPGPVISNIPESPVQHVLVLLRQLGTGGNCSEARPFRGLLGEIALV